MRLLAVCVVLELLVVPRGYGQYQGLDEEMMKKMGDLYGFPVAPPGTGNQPPGANIPGQSGSPSQPGSWPGQGQGQLWPDQGQPGWAGGTNQGWPAGNPGWSKSSADLESIPSRCITAIDLRFNIEVNDTISDNPRTSKP